MSYIWQLQAEVLEILNTYVASPYFFLIYTTLDKVLMAAWTWRATEMLQLKAKLQSGDAFSGDSQTIHMHEYACECVCACVCSCCLAMWTRIRLPHPHCPHSSHTPRTRLPVMCLPQLPRLSASCPAPCCHIRMQIWCKNMWNFRF